MDDVATSLLKDSDMKFDKVKDDTYMDEENEEMKLLKGALFA